MSTYQSRRLDTSGVGLTGGGNGGWCHGIFRERGGDGEMTIDLGFEYVVLGPGDLCAVKCDSALVFVSN